MKTDARHAVRYGAADIRDLCHELIQCSDQPTLDDKEIRLKLDSIRDIASDTSLAYRAARYEEEKERARNQAV